MLLLVGASAALSQEFGRARAFSSDTATPRQIVNVLGRWRNGREWNEAGVGRKGLLDEFRSGDFYDDDVDSIATDFSLPMDEYISRRPQFLDFCDKYGLLPRWVHRETVGSLPFVDDEAGRALAASIGATVAELNAEPVDAVASDVVFDALSMTGMTGFVPETVCDERRASFLTTSGGFDADAFGRALGRSRRNLFGVLALGPGAFSLILLTLSYTYLPQLLDTLLGPAAMAKVERQVALGGPFAFLIPAAVLFRVAIFSPAVAEAVGIKKPRDAAEPLELSRQQRATKARDELYLERMRAKRRGEDV